MEMLILVILFLFVLGCAGRSEARPRGTGTGVPGSSQSNITGINTSDSVGIGKQMGTTFAFVPVSNLVSPSNSFWNGLSGNGEVMKSLMARQKRVPRKTMLGID